ncbi:MAG: tRNA pseudouridine(38-40) synthase TruA [Thermodesulfobacteriota bacterium]
MRNLRLTIEYDGTAYAGWQLQKSDPTVQGTISDVIEDITGECVTLYGASRTDSGVHALGQVANFYTNSPLSLSRFIMGLNHLLPTDIAVMDLTEVPESFDSRGDSLEKRYLYRIVNRPGGAPLEVNRAWLVYQLLDAGLMKEAALLMVGEKDFSSFMASRSDATHGVREVRSIEVERTGDIVEITVTGTAFLRHMIRIIAGTLVTVGRGKLALSEIEGIIEARDRRKAPETAPACGLYLTRIKY